MKIKLKDDDEGNITVCTEDGQTLISWTYANEEERRGKMKHAQFFANGWLACNKMWLNKIEALIS